MSEQGIGFSWGGAGVGRSAPPPTLRVPVRAAGLPAAAGQDSRHCSAVPRPLPGLSSLDFCPDGRAALRAGLGSRPSPRARPRCRAAGDATASGRLCLRQRIFGSL